jgi:branched-chain amino acid transport system substrate-binding protein
MAMKPDMIEISFPKELAVAVFKAAEQQDLGAKFKWGGPTSLYDPDFPKAIGPYWDGKVQVELELEPIDKQSPDMQNWHAVMNKYAAPSLPRDTFAEAGYLSARIATEALLKLDPKKIDRQAVSNAIVAVKGFNSDIMCGPWYFGPGNEHNPNHAGSIVLVKDNGYKIAAGCFDIDDADLAEIRKMEKM